MNLACGADRPTEELGDGSLEGPGLATKNKGCGGRRGLPERAEHRHRLADRRELRRRRGVQQRQHLKGVVRVVEGF